MITQADLRPGDLFFGPIGGIVPGMFPVGAGQLLLADRKARLSWRRWRKIRHCGVVVQSGDSDPMYAEPYGPRLVQAMPRGAEEIELTAKHWTPEYVYIRPDYVASGLPHGPTVQHYREQVVRAARGYVGTPYNFLTYGALAARKFGFMLTDHVLRSWISTRADMMCSQLVDQLLADAGFHVFDDGRLPQDVVPAELYRQLMMLPGQWLVPGGPGWADNREWNGPGVR